VERPCADNAEQGNSAASSAQAEVHFDARFKPMAAELNAARSCEVFFLLLYSKYR
jgi:hypothetical protein